MKPVIEPSANGTARPHPTRNVQASRPFRRSGTRPSQLQRVRDPEDEVGWAEFVRFYEPLLGAYLRARGLPAGDVPDVVQETFLRLLRALQRFTYDPTRGRFRSYLYHVTLSALKDHAARKSVRERVERQWWQDFGRRVAMVAGPDEGWRQAHLRRALELAQAEVKARANEQTWYCYEQRFLAGRPCADIARELDLQANTVAVHARRVFAKVAARSEALLKELDRD
jgi:RNA polymerase sigma-70 factor (ECF subfamily)